MITIVYIMKKKKKSKSIIEGIIKLKFVKFFHFHVRML